MQWFQNVKGHRNWILASEHLVVRFFAIVFSVASAHAIWWFFSALNGADSYQPYVTFLMTLGFAGMGFIISRGLAYRMLHKRSIAVHLCIAVAYEFVEVVCSLTMAVVSIQ